MRIVDQTVGVPSCALAALWCALVVSSNILPALAAKTYCVVDGIPLLYRGTSCLLAIDARRWLHSSDTVTSSTIEDKAV